MYQAYVLGQSFTKHDPMGKPEGKIGLFERKKWIAEYTDFDDSCRKKAVMYQQSFTADISQFPLEWSENLVIAVLSDALFLSSFYVIKFEIFLYDMIEYMCGVIVCENEIAQVPL